MLQILIIGAVVAAALLYLVVKSQDEIRRELGRYHWTVASIRTPAGNEHAVTIRVGGLPLRAAIAMDGLDLTVLQSPHLTHCGYCLARVPHTVAACAQAGERGRGTLADTAAWWEAYGFVGPVRALRQAEAFARGEREVAHG